MKEHFTPEQVEQLDRLRREATLKQLILGDPERDDHRFSVSLNPSPTGSDDLDTYLNPIEVEARSFEDLLEKTTDAIRLYQPRQAKS